MEFKKACLDIVGWSVLVTAAFVVFFGSQMTLRDMLGTFCVCAAGTIPVYLAYLGRRQKV